MMEKIKSLLACALFHDILKPLGILSKILQEEELCVVRGIEAFLRTKKSLEELKARISKILQLSRKCYDGFNKKMLPIAAV